MNKNVDECLERKNVSHLVEIKTIQVKADGTIAAQSSKVELKAKDQLYISRLIADQDVDIQGGKVFLLGQSKGFVPVPDIDAPLEVKLISPNTIKEATHTNPKRYQSCPKRVYEYSSDRRGRHMSKIKKLIGSL